MATSRTSYGKLQRDRAKKERQQLKRDRRFDRGQSDETDEEAEEEEPKPVVKAASTEDILTRVADLHRRFEDEEIEYDDFEEQKLELMAQLTVD